MGSKYSKTAPFFLGNTERQDDSNPYPAPVQRCCYRLLSSWLCFSHGVFSRIISFNDPKAMLLFNSQVSLFKETTPFLLSLLSTFQ
jgi:hypothetical protein